MKTHFVVRDEANNFFCTLKSVEEWLEFVEANLLISGKVGPLHIAYNIAQDFTKSSNISPQFIWRLEYYAEEVESES